MPNNFGTTSTGILAQQGLSLAYLSFLLSIFATDADQLSPNLPDAGKDETIKIKIPTIPAVGNFPSAAQDAGTTEISLTLSFLRDIRIALTQGDINACNTVGTNVASRLMVGRRAKDMAAAIGEDVVSALLAVFTAANGYDLLTAAPQADHDYDYLVDVNAELSAAARRCPQSGRWGLINLATWSNLLKDDRVLRTHRELSGDDPAATQLLRGCAGFDTIRPVPQLATANGTANITGIYGNRSAAVHASRLLRNPSDVFPNAPKNANVEAIIDPQSGQRMWNIEAVDNKAFTAEMIAVILYGVAKGVTQHAVIGRKS